MENKNLDNAVFNRGSFAINAGGKIEYGILLKKDHVINVSEDGLVTFVMETDFGLIGCIQILQIPKFSYNIFLCFTINSVDVMQAYARQNIPTSLERTWVWKVVTDEILVVKSIERIDDYSENVVMSWIKAKV